MSLLEMKKQGWFDNGSVKLNKDQVNDLREGKKISLLVGGDIYSVHLPVNKDKVEPSNLVIEKVKR